MTHETSPDPRPSQPSDLDELEEFAAARHPDSIRPWFKGSKGVLIGVGLGMAIALIGTRLLPTAPRPAVSEPAQANSAGAAAGQSVTVAQVHQTLIPHRLEATGSVAAKNLLPILPETKDLQVRQVLVEENDVVQAGQVMAVLDDSVLRAQLQQAQAELKAAQAGVREKQASLSRSTAMLAEARSNLRRYQDLAKQGAISQQELESRSTTAATAQEDVGVAQANIGSAEATVQSKAAEVERLQTQLEKTLVKAPANGIVAEKLAQVGDVAGSSKLFSIIQNGSLELQAQVPSSQLSQIRVGTFAQISSDTDTRIKLQGRVREIDPVVDAQTRQATIKIGLPASTLLHPGIFLRAAITTQMTQGLTIPAKALLPQSDGSSIVYVLKNDNVAHAQSVQVGMRQAGTDPDYPLAEILSGLSAGDRVILAGAGYLKDGDRVTVAGNGG